MTLYVVRHGVAEDAAPGTSDVERRLTPRGRRRMRSIAQGLQRLGVRPSVLLTSPLPRAAETAAIVAATLTEAPAPRTVEALAPDVGPVDTLRALRVFARHREVMVVGHQPNLGQLVAMLLTGSVDGVTVELRKGGCAVLELTALVPGGATALRAVLPPRILRRLRR